MGTAAVAASNPIRKFVLVVMAPPIGTAVGWGVESASHNTQLATTVGGALTGALVWLNQYLIERQRPKVERIEEARRGEAFPSLAVVLLSVTLGVLVVENLIGFFVGIGLGVGHDLAIDHLVSNGAIREVADAVMTFTVSDQLVGVLIVLTIPVAIFLGTVAGIWGGHRIRTRPWLWLLIAAALLQAVTTITDWAALKGDLSLNAGSLAVGFLFGFGLHTIGILIGLALARRSQSRFVLRQLFRRLDPEDRVALLEVASPTAAM